MRSQKIVSLFTGTVIAALTLFALPVLAQNEAAELAKQLANPVASLISVPFQMNYDQNIGAAEDGTRFTINLQPVVPFELNEQWNLISRTIIPFISQNDIFPGAGSQTGISDIAQTFFFSPHPGPGGLIWGAGPVFLIPAATDDLLGTKKWGAGPSLVILKQAAGWTYGGLANYIVSFAGDSARPDISQTFINPFVSRQFAGGVTVGTQVEHTFDHKNNQDTGQWSLFFSKVTRMGGQNVSFSLAPKYWYQTTNGSPKGFALRGGVSLIFPR